MWDHKNRDGLLRNNDVFWNEYCSEHTRRIIENAGWDTNPLKDKIREAILDLTVLMPDASHGSPVYCSGNNARCLGSCPLIVCAALDNGLRLQCPRIGLCIKANDKEIFLFIQEDTIDWLSNPDNLKNSPISRSDYDDIRKYALSGKTTPLPQNWEEWNMPAYKPGDTEARPSYRSFRIPFNVIKNGTWRDALKSVNADIQTKQKKEVPTDEVLHTVYPKFIEAKRNGIPNNGNFKMRTLVTIQADIEKYQDHLKNLLQSNLNVKMGSRNGKSGILSKQRNDSIWYETLDNHNNHLTSFLNFFGLVEFEKLSERVVEINISKTALKAVQGAFVENYQKEIELIHRGLLNNYKRNDVIEWYRANFPDNVKTIYDGKNKTSEDVIVIGAIFDLDFIGKLTIFIQNVKKFKDENPQTKPNDEVNEGEENMTSNTQKPSLNTILYGPPGTGKTFNTIDEALKIVDKDFFETNKDDRTKLKERFDELVDAKQIRFVTFHQSYSYEEFVEGIRAETVGDQIRYEIKPGVFKKICEAAQTPEIVEPLVNKNPHVWKISIESANNNPTKDYCYANNEARIGWGNSGDLNLEPNLNDPKFKLGTNEKCCLNDFCKNIKVGDILLCINSNSSISGVGVVENEYFYEENPPTEVNGYSHVRKVKWLLKDINFSILPFNGERKFAVKTIDKLSRVNWSIFATALQDAGHKIFSNTAGDKKPFVLIIDEINRGNISKIFGELITLIEDSKRAGCDEALSVTLPYSNEPFSVPNNLYIIGTMNTADRSLALMDTALRRRFDFVEMMPDPSLLKAVTKIKITEDDGEIKEVDLNVQTMLETMNKRITVLYDREHTLGHAFFMSLIEEPTIKNLANIFKNRIIPLLQEYFFEDWEKIRIVLGDDQKPKDKGYEFVTKKEIEKNLFSAGAIKDNRLEKKLSRYSFNESALGKPEAYIGIYPEIGTGQKIPDDGQQDTNNG